MSRFGNTLNEPKMLNFSSLLRRSSRKILKRKRNRQLELERLEDRLAPAGNIIVSNGDLNAQGQHLEEWTIGGTKVRSIAVPPPPGTQFDQARDLAEDPSGNVFIYNGTFTPALATYHPSSSSWTQQGFANWNTVANTTYGGLTYYKGFVYATDMSIAGDPPQHGNGLVRFNLADGTAARFFDGTDFINVNIGLDGMLYALGSPGLSVINPNTMNVVRQVNLSSNHDIRGIAVSAAGDIYTADLDNTVTHFSSAGTLIRDYVTNHYSIGIDLRAMEPSSSARTMDLFMSSTVR